MRVVTSTVVVEGPERRLPVKTDRPIPRDRIFEVMEEIARVRVKAPVKRGDILIPNVAGTEGNVVATKEWPGIIDR